jgi:hypothetical protein
MYHGEQRTNGEHWIEAMTKGMEFECAGADAGTEFKRANSPQIDYFRISDKTRTVFSVFCNILSTLSYSLFTALIMEALLRQSKGMCPFLKHTPTATLRTLSTSTRQSPGGGTITNLNFIARRCPVMNKALAVQSAKISARSYAKVAPGTSSVVKKLLNKKLHTTAEKKASVDSHVIRGAPTGMWYFHRSQRTAI